MEAALDKIQLEYHLTDRERKILQFSFIGILYDLSKFIMLFVFFACIHQLPAFMFNMVLFMILRNNQGGLHLKHYSTCLICSFLFLFLPICILPALVPDIPTPVGLCILFICMLINYIAGPQKNIKIYTQLKDPDNVLKSKRNSFVVCLIYTLMYFIFPNTVLMQQGMWIIVLHTMQIVMVIIKKERSKRND